jgi:hypothetical protein
MTYRSSVVPGTDDDLAPTMTYRSSVVPGTGDYSGAYERIIATPNDVILASTENQPPVKVA